MSALQTYLGDRLRKVSEVLRLESSYLVTLDDPKALQDTVASLDLIVTRLRMLQYEWHKQLLIGAAHGYDANEVAESSLNGLVRID